jgi:hypothetical protein
VNWFYEIFSNILSSPKHPLYQLNYDSEFIVYILAFTVAYAWLKPFTSLRSWLPVPILGVAVFRLDLVPEMPFYHIASNPRLATLSGDAVFYIAMMVFGALSFIGFVSLPKYRKSVMALSTSFALTMMMGLGYSYHVLLINGGLNVQMKVVENQVKYGNMLAGEFRSDYCESLHLICSAPGPADQVDTGYANINQELADYVDENRKHRDDFAFSVSKVLIFTDNPFSLAYVEKAGIAQWTLDLSASRLLFDATRVQFYLFLNSATVFWGMLPAVLIWGHRRRKKRA